MQTKDDLKNLAKRVQKASKKLGYDIKYTHILEIISNVNWNQEWNSVNAKFDQLEKKYHAEIELLKNQLKKQNNHTQNQDLNISLKYFKEKNFSLKTIKELLSTKKLRDKFYLGFSIDLNDFLFKDFTLEPNFLLTGSMGTGKSISTRSILTNWMIGNSDQTDLFIVDVIKGANDYKDFFSYDQVTPILSQNKFHGLIDLLYQEASVRKDKFSEYNARDLFDYEMKSGIKLSRCITLLEELHSLTYNVIDFEKKYKIQGTTAHKLYTLMRIGRSLGIWFIGVSQKATASDIPYQMLPNFTNKAIFKTSSQESKHLIGNDKASLLKNNEHGYCFTDYGKHFFPFLDENNVKDLLKQYVVNKKSSNWFITNKLIKKLSNGDYYYQKDESDFEKLKKIVEIDFSKKFTLIKELDNSFIYQIDKENIYLKIVEKVHPKHINKLFFEKEKNKYDKVILLSTDKNISIGIYQLANQSGIEVLDYEDTLFFKKNLLS